MRRFVSYFIIFCSFFLFAACQQPSSSTETVTQITYIVPIWKGALSEANSNPEVGWAYYNTTVKKSFIYDGSSWQIMAQDGADGLSIIWKGEMSSAPRNPQKNWAYYNTVDGNSYIYNGSSWDYLAKSGRNGTSGILLWLGSFTSAPTNPSEGYAYYNSSEGISYIYSNGSWQILTKDGTNGIDGQSIFWKGAYSSAPSNPQIYWAYFNTTDNCSYIWNGVSWDTLAVSVGGDTTVTVAISWLGSFASAPLNPKIGQAYYNTTVGASYVFDGSVWQQISKDGVSGSSSLTTGYLITWKGSFSSAPANPRAGWAYYNTSAKKSYIYDGSSWQILAQDGQNGSSGVTSTGDSLILVSETTEIIDGITYNVKAYADVYAANPYFYTYYKYYYLNGKLRRVKLFYHSVGADLDYKYDEFVEHTCGSSTGLAYEYIYRENGKLESYVQITYSTGIIYKYEYTYDSDGTKYSQKLYQNDNLYSETIFYPSGKTKIQKSYKTNSIPYQLQSEVTYYESGVTKESKTYEVNVSPSYLSNKTTYYENGKAEYSIRYSPDGTESSRYYYTYYENGNKKSQDEYNNGVLRYSYTYYDNSSTDEKTYFRWNTDGSLDFEIYKFTGNSKHFEINYNSDGTIDRFTYFYSSGYLQYYYTDSGYLYSYVDGKTTSSSTSSSVYSSKISYTNTQAVTKITELKETL